MITVKRLGRHLGAEISGVDLSRPLSDDTFAEIAKAFFDNEVVFFRGQKISPEHQVNFTRRFGVLEQHVRKESRLPGHPEILVVSNIVGDNGQPIGAQDAGRFWHSDLSYKREPSLLSALYSVEVPVKDGRILGDTDFASTTAAYEGLPQDVKDRIRDLKNVHSYVYYRKKNRAAQMLEEERGASEVVEHELTPEQIKLVPDSHAPIVRVHPVSGRKGLFINEAHTSHIDGLPPDESEKLKNYLCSHIIKPEFQYRHHWQPGDLLIWDNAAAQHKATFDYQLPLRRLMYRTTVRGPAIV
jgi:taurine dioxygenase